MSSGTKHAAKPLRAKSVEFAYPTSTNAARFGFSKDGCYTVELGFPGQPAVAVAGFATREEAIAAAKLQPEPWSALFTRLHPEEAQP